MHAIPAASGLFRRLPAIAVSNFRAQAAQTYLAGRAGRQTYVARFASCLGSGGSRSTLPKGMIARVQKSQLLQRSQAISILPEGSSTGRHGSRRYSEELSQPRDGLEMQNNIAPTNTMRIAFYSCKKYDKESFVQVNEKLGDKLHITFLKAKLDASTVSLAKDHQAVCLFVNDDAGAEVLEGLSKIGVKYVSLRCAGKNNVDQEKADALGLEVISVPSYSPDAVAEFAVGMILSLVRKYHKAYNRVREGDFRLSGLEGFNLKGKTVGLIGTGQIGLLTGKILSLGFGCKVIASDPYPNEKKALEFEITYVQTIEELLKASDIISLHCPLLESTHHILNETTLPLTKKGVILVNTSRGGLIDTKALISCLKTGHLGAVGLDVYEGESAYFFGDYSAKIIQDDDLSRLMTFYNVLISGHQAFLTSEALLNIAEYTVEKLLQLEKDKK